MSETTTGLESQYPPPSPHDRIDAGWPAVQRPRPTLPHLDWAQFLALGLAALCLNIAFRTGFGTVGGFVVVALIAGPLLGQTFKRSRTSAIFGAAALIFAAWLPLRASSWLTALNSAAVIASLIAAACTLHPLSLRLDVRTVKTAVGRFVLFRFVGHILAVAARPLAGLTGGRLVPLVRGVLLAVVPVVVLFALLAEADAVFAQSFETDIDPGQIFGHVFLTGFAAVVIASLVAMTSEPVEESFTNNKPLGATEALVLLASIGGLYGTFAVVQIMAAAGDLDEILDNQGLTYAEYARSGFFQLLWVAGLTIVLLALVRLFVVDGTRAVDRAVRIAGAVVSLLTILIVAVAITRLGLYTDAFGQTTLRWYCTAFAWMLGAVFVVLAIGHARRLEHLMPMVVLVIVAVTLVSVNILNPELRVAHHNLTRAEPTDVLDAEYLVRLSADAWPELLDHQDRLVDQLDNTPPQHRTVAFDGRCQRASEQAGYGPLGFNLAKAGLTCPDFDG